MIHTSGSTLARSAPHTPPLVSVCIPSQPARAVLREETIASVRAQTYPNIEIVVKEHKDWWQTKINECVQAAVGEYMLILPDDDLLEPTYIARGMEVMSHTNIFFTAQKLIGDRDDWYQAGLWNRKAFREGNPVGGMTGLMPRYLWLKLGGYSADVMFQDYEFWGRAFLCGTTATVLQEPLLKYRWHAGMKGKSEDHAAGLAEVRARLGF